MDMKAFEITTKMMVGEDVTEDEKSYARNYNAKYSIVRHLILEKLGDKMKNFHFTPGDDFMTTPTIDVVNAILHTLTDATPIEFGDGSLVDKYDNPPYTGRTKGSLLKGADNNDSMDSQL